MSERLTHFADRLRRVARLGRLALISLLLLATGCSVAPIYARRIEGRVVEWKTGKPVAGAEVFAAYQGTHARGNRAYTIDWRWTTSAEDGSFAIPGHFKLNLIPPDGQTEPHPVFIILHREYGKQWRSFGGDAAQDFPGWREIVLEIERGPGSFLFAETHRWSSLCRGLSEGACDRMCVVAYGSLEACYEGGRFPPE